MSFEIVFLRPARVITISTPKRNYDIKNGYFFYFIPIIPNFKHKSHMFSFKISIWPPLCTPASAATAPHAHPRATPLVIRKLLVQ